MGFVDATYNRIEKRPLIRDVPGGFRARPDKERPRNEKKKRTKKDRRDSDENRGEQLDAYI